MHRGVASRRGTASLAEEKGVIDLADDHLAGWPRILSVALQTQIGVTLDEHLLVHGAMRIVTSRATFSHRFVFIDEVTGLLPVTARARFI